MYIIFNPKSGYFHFDWIGKKKDVSAFRHDHDTVVTTQKIVIIVTLMSKMKART